MWWSSLLLNVHPFRSYRDKTGKMLGFWEAMRPLFTPLVFFALGTAWVYQSGSDIINKDPRLYLFMIGTIFTNVNVGICTYFYITFIDIFSLLIVFSFYVYFNFYDL